MAQSLLCKVGETIVGPAPGEPQFILTNVSGGISNRSGFHTIGTPFNIRGTGYRVVINGSTYNYTGAFLANPDTQVKYVNLPYNSGSDTFTNYEATFTKGVDDNLQFGGSCNAGYSNGTVTITSAAFYRTTSDLYKTGKYLKPMIVSEIGIKTNLISFGRLTNGVWRDGN